jgi:hypothetical protein
MDFTDLIEAYLNASPASEVEREGSVYRVSSRKLIEPDIGWEGSWNVHYQRRRGTAHSQEITIEDLLGFMWGTAKPSEKPD